MYTMQNKFSNCFVWVSPSTLDLKFHFLVQRYKRRSCDKDFHVKQEMSQARDECPKRNWSSIRHI